MVRARGCCVEDALSGSRLTPSEVVSSYIVVGVFDFPLLRAEKRDGRWLVPLVVAGVVGVWGLLFLDPMFDLALELVPSCCGVGCVEFSIELLFLFGLMGGSNLCMKVPFFSFSLPTP